MSNKQRWSILENLRASQTRFRKLESALQPENDTNTVSTTARTARGIIWNWVALATNFIVVFFLTPFIVHHLGNVIYGIWTVIVSIISYMGLLDLGLRGAVTRFISRDHALGNHEEASQALSAALWFRQWIGLSIIVLSFLLAIVLHLFFPIPQQFQFSARWALVVTGITLAVNLLFGVFGGVLAALHRFDVYSGVQIGQTFIRAGGVIWILKSGHGILALALWELAVSLASSSLMTASCFRVYPQLHVVFRFPKREILREFWRYSSFVFLIHIFGQIIYYTDNLVVGIFISVVAVTFYSIGGSLSEYLRQIVASATTTFMPLASQFEASGEKEQLRKLLVQGTRTALLISLPVQLALFFRGRTFIGLWMGSQYGPVSGTVLQILLISQLFIIANSTSLNIAFGLGKHAAYARWAGAEALANLLLSVFLARRVGIYGVAIGTVIPSLFVQIILWPRYISSIVGLPLGEHIWQSWLRPMLAAIPYAAACYLTERFWSASGLMTFFLQIAAILPAFLFGVILCFYKEAVWQLRSKTAWFS